MSAPTFSICIPAYARPATLLTAIDSVLSQDFDDLEVIVGDDSGELEAVVHSRRDARVRYHRNPNRLGMAGNWNAVLDRAEGRFLGLLMDDDRLLPGFLRHTLKQLETDSSVGVVFTNHVFDEGGRLRPRECGLAQGRYENFLPHYLEHMPVAVSAAVMRREVWQHARPLPDLRTADVVLHVRAGLRGWPFYYIDEPLMAYGVHAGQLSSLEQFREDVVEAWEQFDFEDPTCERLRRGRLAAALASRAGAHLKRGRTESAREDIARARILDGGSVRLRRRAIAYLAAHPRLSRAVVTLLSRVRLVSS
jgi:GT2 family glycosyltransferase